MTSCSYHSPKSVQEATELVRKCGSRGRILAGGQTLIPKLRESTEPEFDVIDLRLVTELNYVRKEAESIRIGAMCRLSTMEQSSEIQKCFPIVPEVLSRLASRPIRNQSTVGGSLALADSRSDICCLAVLLDANIAIIEDGQPKIQPVANFLQNRHSSKRNYLVCELQIPITGSSAGIAFSRLTFHPHEHSFLSVGASIIGGQNARVTIGAATKVPQRAAKLEDVIVHSAETIPSIAEMAQLLDEIVLEDDVRSTKNYQRHVLAVLAHRTVATAFERAR